MANEGDRISHLPDDILLHILSFLQYTVERARTSLLSKRWRNLWAYHPVIRFSSHQPRFSHVGPDTRDHIRAVDECLKGFKAPTLQALEIVIWLPGHKCSTSEAEASARATARWILFAGLRSVRNLHLWVEPLKRRPDIQGSIFCCQMITALDLVLCTIEGVPSRFQGFIFLKDLKLSCSPVSGNVLCLLLSKCPVLESLCLIGCHNVVNLNVSSQSLRHIVLSTGSKRGHLSIDAPNLRSIKFKGNVQNLFLKNAPCLLDANIQNLGTGTSSETRLCDWVRPVQKLQVDHWFFQYVIPKSPLLIFKNLKELHCNNEWVTNPMLRALITIIGHCPTLEELQVDLFNGNRSRVLAHMRRDNSEVPQEDDRAILSKYVDNYIKGSIDYEERERWGPLEQFGDIGDSSHCLKTVVVKAFLGTTNEMRLVEYLLKNGDVLETLTIADFLGRNKEEICQLFTYIPKASLHVQTDARVLLRNFR